MRPRTSLLLCIRRFSDVREGYVLTFGEGKSLSQLDDALSQREWLATAARQTLEARQVLVGWRMSAQNLTTEQLKQRQAHDLTTEQLKQRQAHARSTRIHNVRLISALKLCSISKNLEWGRRIHAEVVESGKASSIHVATALIHMYAKCGKMVAARQVFDGVRQPDVIAWNVLLLGYAENGDGLTTLNLFSSMKLHGYAPDSITYVAVLKACTSLAQKEDGGGKAECLKRGRQIHSEIACKMDLYLQNTLITMYAKCGSMVEARQVFDSIRDPDVVSWTGLILGHGENGGGLLALDLFSRMKLHGLTPDSITYVAALKACTSLARTADENDRLRWLRRGKQIHSEIGCRLDIYVQKTLIDMYAKCGSMLDALQVFETVSRPDVVSWNILLLGYAENGEGPSTLDLFSKMKLHGCAPDSVTYMAVFKACGLLGALEYGRKVHAQVTEFSASLVTCLVDFYAKCGSLVEAQDVFDLHSKTRDLTTWTALLAGYSCFGETDFVFRLFEAMQDEGFQPDCVAFLSILICCSHAGHVDKAWECLERMSAKHKLTPTVKHYNCMVDVLGRANKLDDTLVMLREMSCSPNVVTWTSVLCACRKWKNAEIGRLAFDCLVSLDDGDTAAYVVMAHIYASRGMWNEEKTVLAVNKSQAWEVSNEAWWTNEAGEVHRLWAPADFRDRLWSHERACIYC